MRTARLRSCLAAACLVMSACGGGGGGGSGGGGAVSDPPPAGSDYFPLAAGDQWLYRVDQNGSSVLYHVDVGPTRTVGGLAQTDLITATLDGSTVDVSTFASTADGVTALPTPGDALSTAIGPYLLLRLPVQAGDAFVQVDKLV